METSEFCLRTHLCTTYSVLAKTGSCMNPLIFAFSHPRYREELARLVPSLGIGQFYNIHFFYSDLVWPMHLIRVFCV